MTSNTKTNGAAHPNHNEQAPNFEIQRLYTKDVSFEAPNTPQLFREDWQPSVQLDLAVESNQLETGVYEVILTVTATVKNGDSDKAKTAFLAEAHQAGIFTLTGFDDAMLRRMLGSYCPNVLFPYAREAISSLVQRGGFPQLYLAPVNFDAVYEDSLKQAQAENADPDQKQVKETATTDE